MDRLQDIAFEMSKIAIFGYPSWVYLKSPTDGFPDYDLRKIFRGCQRMAKVPNGVEKLPKISTGEVGCTNVTDDRQTGGTAIAYSERVGDFTFAKTEVTSKEYILHLVQYIQL